MDDFEQNGSRVIARKGFTKCDQFEENDTDGKNISAAIHFFSANLLRRHVMGRSHNHSSACKMRCGDFCNAEIHNLYFTVIKQSNVGRFYIPMNNSFGVRVSESLAR